MGISEEDLARVREATDLVALVGLHTALRRQGRRWVGLCPFHAEKSPSFSVNAEEGLYYCFGCKASGDAITFVRDTEHLDFADAVERLAARAGITIERQTGLGAPEQHWRQRLFDAMAEAVEFYHQRMLFSPDAARAREYLRSRGYDGDIVRKFKLGWAPSDWDALSSAVRWPERLLKDTGLGMVNKIGRKQDFFRARVIFPIFDPAGRAVALGGRVLPEPGQLTRPSPFSSEPKYRNSPETPIYSKRRVLYGLNWAKDEAARLDEIIVCEGYTDAIAFYQAGMARAVATCGTTLTEDHVKLLSRHAHRLILAYDADPAGQRAIEQYYTWEHRYELDVRVADLPSGMDPAEVALKDREALSNAVSKAKTLLGYRVDRILGASAQKGELAYAEGRARAGELALRAVAEHPSDLVRDQYVMMIADRCRIEPERLRALLARLRASSASIALASASSRQASQHRLQEPQDGGLLEPSPGVRATLRKDSRITEQQGAIVSDKAGPGGRRDLKAPSRPGLEALRLAVHRPDLAAGRLEWVLFSDPVQRRAFQALAGANNLHQAISAADAEAADLLLMVAAEPDEVVPDAEGVIAHLVREATRRALAELSVAARLASSDEERTSIAREDAWARLMLEELAPDGTSPAAVAEAADHLLAWLLRREEDR